MFGQEMLSARRKQKGFILFLTLILMSSMGAISGALAISLTHDTRELAIQSSNAKAFWLAEAGIADAQVQIKNNQVTFVSNAASIPSMILGDGTYSVALTSSRNEITIISTGTCNGQTRIVKEIRTIPAFNYAVFGNNSDATTLRIGNVNTAATRVTGDIFFNATAGVDTVQVNNAAIVTGLIYADVVTGGGSYTKATGNPSPVPTYPTFTSTSYDTAVIAAHSVPGSQDLNQTGGTFDLAVADSYGQTGVHYFDQVTINGVHIKGPGTIVTDTSALIQNNAIIDADVNIYAKGNITIGNSNNGVNDTTTVAAGGVMYSQANIIVRNHSSVSSSLLTPSTYADSTLHDVVRIQESATFTGIIYADTADIADSVIVRGSIVAKQFTNNAISNTANLTWGSSSLPTAIPASFPTSNYVHKPDSWQET